MKRAVVILALAVWLPCAAAEHGGEGADHGDSTTLWKWANFAVLAGALGYVISKTAGAFFRSRTRGIEEGVREAARLRDQAEARAAEIDRRLANLAAEIESLRKSAAEEMAAEGKRIEQETAQQLAKVQANAQQEIATAANQARKDLREYAAGLSLRLARGKIARRLTPAVDESLVDAFVLDMARPDRRVN